MFTPISEFPVAGSAPLSNAIGSIGFLLMADGVKRGSCIRWKSDGVLAAAHHLQSPVATMQLLALFGFSANTAEDAAKRSIYTFASLGEGAYFSSKDVEDAAFARLGIGRNTELNRSTFLENDVVAPSDGLPVYLVGYRTTGVSPHEKSEKGYERRSVALKDSDQFFDVGEAMDHGMSGGGVIAEDGRLVGIILNDGTTKKPQAASVSAFLRRMREAKVNA